MSPLVADANIVKSDNVRPVVEGDVEGMADEAEEGEGATGMRILRIDAVAMGIGVVILVGSRKNPEVATQDLGEVIEAEAVDTEYISPAVLLTAILPHPRTFREFLTHLPMGWAIHRTALMGFQHHTHLPHHHHHHPPQFPIFQPLVPKPAQ